MTKGLNRYQASRQVLFATLWLTLFVLSVKVSAGWATRSLSLLAESLHTLITSFSTLLSLLAVTARDHPGGREVYGHSKQETIATLLFVALLGFASLNLFTLSCQQLIAQLQGGTLLFPVRASLPLIKLVSVVALTSIGLAFLTFYKAKLLNSFILRFNARQQLKDIGLMLIVLLGLIAAFWGFIWLDLLMTIVLVIFASISAWHVLNRQLPLLIQQTAIAPEVLAKIAREAGGVTHCYQIRSRGVVGRLVYIQMRLILHPDYRSVAPLITQRIDQAIRDRYGSVQVKLYIDEVAPATGFSSASPLEQFNGKNDPQKVS